MRCLNEKLKTRGMMWLWISDYSLFHERNNAELSKTRVTELIKNDLRERHCELISGQPEQCRDSLRNGKPTRRVRPLILAN